MAQRKEIIGVIGGSQVEKALYALAQEIGRGIAGRGAILITGGMGGVMEAASQGAKEAGGLVIGVLPGSDAAEANPWVDVPIVTGMSHARNTIIARTAQALIAVDGSYGTLSEIAFALIFSKPVIGLQTWEIDPRIHRVKDAKHAVELAFALLKS